MNSIFSSSKPIVPSIFVQSTSIFGSGTKSQTSVWFLWPTISKIFWFGRNIVYFFKKNNSTYPTSKVVYFLAFWTSSLLAFKYTTHCLAPPITWGEKILFCPSETVLRRSSQPTVKCFKTQNEAARRKLRKFVQILWQRLRLNNETSGVTQISHTCFEKKKKKR